MNKNMKKISVIFFLLCAGMIWNASFSSADILVVPYEYTYIQDAIDVASSGDTVLIWEGTYPESVTMKDGVAVSGIDKYHTFVKGVVTAASNTTFENLTVQDESSGSGTFFIGAGCDNVKIRNNRFIVDTSDTDYMGLILMSCTSAQVFNNSFYMVSAATPLTGISISAGDVFLANNSLYLEGPDVVKGLVYAGNSHTVKNNIIETRSATAPESAIAITGSDVLQISYNLLMGSAGENVVLKEGNMKGVGPSFASGDQSLKVQDTSVAVEAADPNYLYSSGVKDIGAGARPLTAHYRFQYNANDETGNHHGTVHGPIPFIGRWNPVEGWNKAYRFDGIDDYISIPTDDEFDFGKGDFSISLWFVTDTSEKDCIMGFYGPGGVPRIELFINYSLMYPGNVAALVFSPAAYNLVTPGTYFTWRKYNRNRWHHLALVLTSDRPGYQTGYGKTQNLRLYADGTLIGSKLVSYPGELGGWEKIWIGGRAGYFYKGTIDSVRIWDYALTSAEVEELYENKN